MCETYVRFVIRDRDDTSGYWQGFFQEAYRQRNLCALSADEHETLAALLKWFGKNLHIPKRFNRSRAKGWWRRDPRGICWFKASSIEQVSKAQQIASIMRRNGIDVFEVRSDRPGFVVFADDHQVVAEPFSDVVGVR